MDCVFCKIAAGEVPGDILYRDEEIVAFRDISPMAPVHLLVIPVKHINQLADLSEADLPLMARLIGVANQLARQEGVAESGYRLVINSGKEGGQVVPHLHMHVIGGRPLSGRLG
jgi:histidine triad (HIT) family protein